ncbi:polysaccharide biosynthesis/export family protein [Thermodesulfobacteriota bacterium]
MEQIFLLVRKCKFAYMLKEKYNLIFIYTVLASSFLLQGCYSNTAIEGTPVPELVRAEDPRVVKKEVVLKTDELSSLVGAGDNKSFKEIEGIPEYRIGPLDILQINSHIGEEITSTEVTVNNRGKISYSFIDDLVAAGFTPSELDDLLTKRLSDYIIHPRIDILVTEFKSKKVTVLGEVSSLRTTTYGGKGASGRINLQGKTSIMDLIALSGGFTVDADIKNVRFLRQGRTYRLNVYDILERGDERQNIIVDDGDVLEIPELPKYGERVYVLGEVVYQGIYPLKDARDLLGALSLAGNVTPLAIEENTLIVRAGDGRDEPLVMMSDIKSMLRKADISQNVELKDGDLVYVPRMKIGDLNDWIENTWPLLQLLEYPADLHYKYNRSYKLSIDTN